MTKRWRRVGAFALALSMCASMIFGSVPALAASEAAASVPDKPKLVMDFLGDNKAAGTYYNKTALTGGGLGDGSLPTPADSDQAWQSTADDGQKWNGYVQADAAASASVSGTQTIFWMGIGIQDIDKFVLSKDGNGLYSAEVALYYNPYYVEPYDDPSGAGDLKTCIENNMLGTGSQRNQWPAADYKVVKALAGLEPLNDPNDGAAAGDFTAAKYNFNEGYGTEEFSASDLWKMVDISVEMTESQLLNSAWLSGSHDPGDTYYIAMVPFVLHHYDPDNELCIRLSRNASTFSIGSKKNNGMGQYKDGDVTYGNWDKYTYHDPDHDLKLMLDYTGDLNIFTNERKIDYLDATLIINNGGNADNKAQMIINNEPLPAPSQLADATGEQIIHLTGGEELRVSAKKMTGFTVSIEVKKDDGSLVAPISITAVNPWTDEWTFLMPSDESVTVTVTFVGKITTDTKFKVDLEVIDNNYNEPNNTAKLTAPGGATTLTLTTGTDTLTGGAAAGTQITVSVTRNSDYNVKVTLIPATGLTPTLNHIIDQSEAQTYTFQMEPSDITVRVEFELKEPHKATLAVQGNVSTAQAANNWAKMGYTDGHGTSYGTGVVSFADANSGPSSTPGLDNNQIQSASGRTIHIDTVSSPEYRVSGIIFRKSDDTLDPNVTATATTIPGRYEFTMPDYEIKVIVVYELVKTYRVRLLFDTTDAPQPGEGAILNGTDARGTLTLALSQAQYDAFVAAGTLDANNLMEVFPDANMGVSFFHDVGGAQTPGLGAGRTAEIEVYYPEYGDPLPPNTDVIIPTGSAGSGFSFPMRELNNPDTDAVYVIVHFKAAQGQDLIARIYEDRSAGVGTNEAKTVWAGIAPGHNSPITVHENDQIAVSIQLQPGIYIASVQVYDEGVPTPIAPSYVGAPLGIPVTLSGIGYNNGQGGTETASFIMPNQNATIVVKYGKGLPPTEPEFTATIRKTGDGTGDIDITNETTGNAPHTASNAKWVDAKTGHRISATYKPTGSSYVSGVTVTADVPGTTINWTTTVNPDGSTTISVDTMPAANVVISVEFTDSTEKTPSQLTLKKVEPTSNTNNKATAATSGGTAQVGAVTTATTTAYENELVRTVIDVDAGWHIVSAVATPDAGGSTIPVTLSGNGYHGGAGGTETATFQMPAGAATLAVTFAEGAPANTITLVVDDPATMPGNTATLYLDGAAQSPVAVAGTNCGPMTAAAGTPVQVVITKQAGYSVDLPILTTPSGVVNMTWTAVDTFEFVMPDEPLTVTVPFLPNNKANDEFYADLIFRPGGDESADGVRDAKGTFLNNSFTNDNYADQLNGTLRYSRAARPGEDVPFAVRIPDGYYISNITVTPADFDVTPVISGMIGTQRGEFLMPMGNVRVNVYISKGWPDEAKYRVTLHVDGPDDRSTATLTNVTANPSTSVGPLPTAGQSGGSAFLTGLDGDKMRVTLDRDPSHDLDSITIVDGNEMPVSYHWATDGGYPAVEFSVPGSSVDVYVKYTDQLDTTPYNVRLHVDQGGTSATATMTQNGNPIATPSFTAQGGDDIGLTVSGPANALITYAYAVAGDGTMVSLGDPALAGSFAGAVATEPHGFIMPFHTDVDVYIGFTTATPGNNEYSLTLQVNGDASPSSGTVTVREFDSNDVKQGEMSAAAVGGNAMLAHGGNKITAEVVPAGGYALYSLIAYTSTGQRVVVSLDAKDNNWRTYTFTMPEDTTHIEAEFRKAEPGAYQIQVVVNNTVNNGAGNNDAFLYAPPGTLQGGFKFKSGVNAGDTFDLGFIVDTGYQVQSILAVPQGSGVAANIPLPATSSGRTQVKMPASNLVIYVTFRMDNTTRYNVIGTISYPDGVNPPVRADDGSNKLKLIGSENQNSTLESDDTTPPGSVAMIQEAQGNRVDVKWTPATDYVVSSYTVKTSAGQVVLSEPNATQDGCFFYMPGAPVEVNVIFTKPTEVPPADYTATLHYVGAGAGDQASIAMPGATGSPATTNGGVISGLHVGDKIDISATPGSGRYLQTIYVLQSGPDMAQNGQTLPLQNSSLTTIPATGDFFMPSGNVDVYVVFAATQPDPNDYMATVKVNAGGSPNTMNFAVISTSAVNSATAYCDSAPASIVATQQSIVTVTVTVDSNHVIDTVTGTPITPSMQPQLSANGTTVYTFTMPANNASIIVNLKEKQATKYKLYLHVYNQVETTPGELDNDNETKLEYGNPMVDSLVRQGAAPTQTDPVIPYLDTPGGSPVTLTVTPGQNYYVRAAYVVYENGLVEMTPAPLPSGYTYNRTTTGLEGTTSLDIGVSGSNGEAINTATFTMPKGNAHVYVVYEKGTVPTVPWYNVVVIATDSGGTPGNAGHGRVKVSSSPVVTGAAAAIDPAATVPSTGLATYFYSVPYQETIHLDASDADSDYQYDMSTGMVLTYQTPGTTAAPAIHPVNVTNYPRGEIQEFGMPQGNVGVRINFTKTGVRNLTAQLHVVQADGIPGYSANTVTMSAGEVGTPSYQAVNNSELTAAGPTGGNSGNPDTTNNMILTDLTSQQLISTLIHPRDSATRVVQVTVTQVDKSGNIIGSTFATHAGDPTNSGQDWYNYIMGENDVHVYVVLAKKTDTDRFVAVATPSYATGVTAAGDGSMRNEITGLTNTTTAGLSSAPYWTEVKAKDRVKVTYTAQTGVYVEVKAYRADNGQALADPVEFGVGNGAAGYAYVDIPDPGCDVEIQVIFSTTPPSDKTLSFVSHDHAGKPKNETELQKEDPDNAGSYITLSGALTPSAGVLTDLVWPVAPVTDSETPGTNLKVLINDLEPGYEVKKVEVKVDTFTIDYYMKDPQNTGTLILVDSNDDPVNLVMPNGNTVITVHFKEKDDGLVPYDPRNENSTDYKDHWIKAENRGDYLIVTVPLLNNADGNNPTSVTWEDKEKEDRFKFYLDETPSGATTPVYTSIDYILKRSRPADAPAATGTEPYWKDNFLGTYYDPDTYEGAQFIVEIMSDKEIDDNNSITNKAAAKTLAATLRKIMDNDGTKANGDKYSLYISCEETTYKADGTVDKKTEGAKVDFEVPRYYALIGMLESYAPDHIATFTLTDEATGSTISFTSKLEGTNGVDLWQQDFKVKLTSDFDGKLKDRSFTLTIEKAGHVTYTRTTIILDTGATAPAGTYDDTNLVFQFTEPIHLFGGDLDNNGYVEQRDVQLLIAVTNGYFPVTQAQASTDAGWATSVYNPASVAYAADLNGDREIDVRDMNIVLDGANYGRSAEDYGAPTGLSGIQTTMLLMLRLPEWYTDMLAAGMTVPAWAEEMVQARIELPDWMGEMVKAEADVPEWMRTAVAADIVIPEWVGELAQAGIEVPEWVKEFVETDVAIPAWAVEQIAAGYTVPAWIIELIASGEELPVEVAELLDRGEPLPETRPEEKLFVAAEAKQLGAIEVLDENKIPAPEKVETTVVPDKSVELQATPVTSETEKKEELEAPVEGTENGSESGSATEKMPGTEDASNVVDSGAEGEETAENRPVEDDVTTEKEDAEKGDEGIAAEGEPIHDTEDDGDELAEEVADNSDDVTAAGAEDTAAQELEENAEEAPEFSEQVALQEEMENILYTSEEIDASENNV